MEFKINFIAVILLCCFTACGNNGKHNADTNSKKRQDSALQYIGLIDNNKKQSKEANAKKNILYGKSSKGWTALHNDKAVSPNSIQSISILNDKRGHDVFLIYTRTHHKNNNTLNQHTSLIKRHFISACITLAVICGIFVCLGLYLYKKRRLKSEKPVESERINHLQNTSIFIRIQEMSKDKDAYLSDEQWTELIKEIDSTYDDFTKRLYNLYPAITDIEQHICLLIKIGIPVSAIPHLMVKAKSSIGSIRERLFFKMFNKKGSTTQMDDFIKQF